MDRDRERPGVRRDVDDELRRRAAVYAALGEPTRLAIVDELVASDRSPIELSRRLGLAPALLAHHLDVLADAGLIERTVSGGDRRRRYVTLRHDIRRHDIRRHDIRRHDIRHQPALGAAGDGDLAVGRPVIFVCTHNSARSQLAAALWTRHVGSSAESGGTHPADRIHPEAVAAGHRAGLALTGVPRRLDPNELAGPAQIVTVCDRAHEELAPHDDWWHWSIPDPATSGEPERFDQVVDQLDRRITAVAS